MARKNISILQKMKRNAEKITAITAYDASFAKIFDEANIDVILVGDSLGMVLQGHSDTLPVTTDEIAYHTRCVANGADNTFIIADMPFMSYATVAQTYENAAKLMQAGAQMVKLEGGDWLFESIKGLTERGVPVCGHLGLTPQSVNVFGGFKVQGRQEDKALEMIEHAKKLEEAGAQLIVIECVPSDLAAQITEAVSIPVIGIGAGVDVDGQILVMHDILGISAGIIPKFSKNYIEATGDIRRAVMLYKEEVQAGTFPGTEHSFS